MKTALVVILAVILAVAFLIADRLFLGHLVYFNQGGLVVFAAAAWVFGFAAAMHSQEASFLQAIASGMIVGIPAYAVLRGIDAGVAVIVTSGHGTAGWIIGLSIVAAASLFLLMRKERAGAH